MVEPAYNNLSLMKDYIKITNKETDSLIKNLKSQGDVMAPNLIQMLTNLTFKITCGKLNVSLDGNTSLFLSGKNKQALIVKIFYYFQKSYLDIVKIKNMSNLTKKYNLLLRTWVISLQVGMYQFYHFRYRIYLLNFLNILIWTSSLLLWNE